jgi:tRNA threonylcarbamoyladenosine biosynthesis protein TsaE
MRTWRTASERETREVGRELAAELLPGGTICLRGELGAGKTTLVQGLGSGLGIDPTEVQSPSYTIIREHEGPGGRLVHIDLYRLDPDQVDALGMEEVLSAPAIKAIEWPERLPFPLSDALHVEMRRIDGGAREIRASIDRDAREQR